jgi:phenylalanyl-tRNA synthetase alpha chain
MTDLDTLQAETEAALAAATDLRALDAIRVGVLGKSGRLTAMLKELGRATPDERRERGRVP